MLFFLLDHDVDAGVGRVLRQAGHRCETASTVGLATADDDQISVYADNHRAVLITHDKEAIRRRRKNTFGRHVYLHCDDIDAVETIAKHLADVVLMITTRDAIVLKVAKDGVGSYPNRWQ